MLIMLTCFTACTPAPQPPTVETVVVFLPATQEPPPQCVILERENPLPMSLPPPPKRPKSAKALPPAQLIQQAEREALIQPTAQGYHGGSARQKYLWQPGKLFSVYLHPTAATEIELPPNEQLASGLSLNPDLYEVSTVRVGSELATKDVIKLRPLTDTPSTLNVSLLTTSGRSYDLHLIVGTRGMFGVRFELAPILQVPAHDDDGVPKERR
jgi:type IV secretory pathway VirB9-like protein